MADRGEDGSSYVGCLLEDILDRVFEPADDLFNTKLVLDVKIKIFSYLPTDVKLLVIPDVCNEWREIVHEEPTLWTTMKVTINDIPIDICLEQLQRSPLLKKLTVCGNGEYYNCDLILWFVSTDCPELEELILEKCSASKDGILSITLSSKKLRVIKLVAFSANHENDFLLFSACATLEKFSIDRCDVLSWYNQTSEPTIPWDFCNLKELTMDGPPPHFQARLLSQIGHKLDTLHADRLSHPDIFLLLPSFPQLKTLDLQDAFLMEDTSLLGGLGQLVNLRNLVIPGASQLSPDAVLEFLCMKTVVGRLELLDLSYVEIDDCCLEAIAENCGALRTLHVTPTLASLDCLKLFVATRVPPLQTLHVWYPIEDIPPHFMDSCYPQKGCSEIMFINMNGWVKNPKLVVWMGMITRHSHAANFGSLLKI